MLSGSPTGRDGITKAIEWPEGAQCAVSLTFDFDAETIWAANDERNSDLPATLSLGRYGAKVGVPKILELLRHEEIKATFFVPGWTADNHTQRVEEILADGHEVAHHGYSHEAAMPDDPSKISEELDRGLEALARVGVSPQGYRAPDGVSSELSLRMQVDRGLTYDSSFKDGFLPYRHLLADGTAGPIEIPEQPTLDDWAYGATSLDKPRPLFPKDQVLSIWCDEFRELYNWARP